MADETHSDVDAGAPLGLADRLKAATAQLHTQAEKTGFVGRLLRQQGSRAGYVIFLRNLLPVYEALEHGLAAHASTMGALHRLARPELSRAAALRADLAALYGRDWEDGVALLASGRAYADRVAAAGEGNGLALAGHAYTRYLGDLNGGQVLARLLARGLQLPPEALTFYDFPAIDDPHAYAARYRSEIDALSSIPGAFLAIEEEARASFRCAIALSDDVAALS